MRISIAALGTRGDVLPLVALGVRLRTLGHEIRLATHREFEGLATRHGFPFHPVPGSYQDFVAAPEGRRALDVPRGTPLGLLGLLAPFRTCAEEAFHQLGNACDDAEGIICSPIASIIGNAIAEAKDVPLAIASPIPPIGSRHLPAPAFPAWPLGTIYNRLTNVASAWLVVRGSATVLEAWRREAQRIAPATRRPVRAITLVAVSPLVVPRPIDWPSTTHVTGYWFPRGDAAPAVPEEVRAFVEAGPPPICLGFGSMADDNPDELRAIVLDALARLNRRAVIVGGSGGALLGFGARDHVCEAPFVDYDWLFHRVSAVVHQGGAGTAAYCFAAGLPQVIVPYCLDHTFWAWRLRQVGVAPPAIRRHKMTAAALAETIRQATDNPSFRTRAALLAPAIAAEDGLERAVRIVSDHFEQGSAVAEPVGASAL
jgi:UDP:flavonoid glycosyltransferase YjiC (YdhE family)